MNVNAIVMTLLGVMICRFSMIKKNGLGVYVEESR